MRKVFWEDPYQTKLTTKVAAITGNKELLEETIGYAFSGGQESDAITINDLYVTMAEKEGYDIYYSLPDNHGLSVGDVVHMTIDGLRRYRLMRLHFAAELVLELVVRKWGLEKIGAHIAEDKARIDFLFDENISQNFSAILENYAEIIHQNKMIKTGYLDRDKQRRYWKIANFSQVPCGGTHVKTTAEVGLIRLKRKNIGSGKERVEIYLLEPDLMA